MPPLPEIICLPAHLVTASTIRPSRHLQQAGRQGWNVLHGTYLDQMEGVGSRADPSSLRVLAAPQSDPADANSVDALITTGAWDPDSGVQTVEDAGPPARQPESSNLGERFIERGNAAAVHVGLYLD